MARRFWTVARHNREDTPTTGEDKPDSEALAVGENMKQPGGEVGPFYLWGTDQLSPSLDPTVNVESLAVPKNTAAGCSALSVAKELTLRPVSGLLNGLLNGICITSADLTIMRHSVGLQA